MLRFTVLAALLHVGSALPAQVTSPAQVNLTGREFDLLRDVIAAQWNGYNGPDGQLCLDPTVAAYRIDPSTPRERWSGALRFETDAIVRNPPTTSIVGQRITRSPANGVAKRQPFSPRLFEASARRSPASAPDAGRRQLRFSPTARG